MNGPRLICAACGDTTTINKPICDACVRAAGGTPVEYCSLCESSVMLVNSPILAADKFGVHHTKAGGYAGKCTALTVSLAQEPR